MPFLILVFSISAPFAIHDVSANGDDSRFLLYNILTFLGITASEKDRKRRKFATNTITLFENVPQFLVVTYEMFDFGFSVNFIQAANPIFTVFMFYKYTGTWLGGKLYKSFGFFAFLLSFFLLPQLYVGQML